MAQDLLGKKLVRIITNKNKKRIKISGIIVETESYGFKNDQASHAFKGITKGNQVMFGPVGRSYVYFIYGNHFCLNVSARSDERRAGAVLLRALEPCEGIHIMNKLRNAQSIHDLTSGPGKLCQAMDISRSQNYLDMTDPQSELRIEYVKEDCMRDIAVTRRVRVRYATNKKWRFAFNPVPS